LLQAIRNGDKKGQKEALWIIKPGEALPLGDFFCGRLEAVKKGTKRGIRDDKKPGEASPREGNFLQLKSIVFYEKS
jgi:hypothetical protein